MIAFNIFFIGRDLDENGWVVILGLNELGRLSDIFFNFLTFIEFFKCFNQEGWLVIINCLTFACLGIPTLILLGFLWSWVVYHLVDWVCLVARRLLRLLRSCHLVIMHHTEILYLLHVSNEWHYMLATTVILRLLKVWVKDIGIHLSTSEISIHSHHKWLRSHHELLIHFELTAPVLILHWFELHHLFLVFNFKIFNFILS